MPCLTGSVKFYQDNGSVLIVANICGLPKTSETGFFGFHIHQGNNCSGIDVSGAKGHYDPSDLSHPKHAGDLPPLLSCNGGAYLSLRTDWFSVKDIIGRTVVIHSDSDDFHTQPAGNAGKRIACGIICGTEC